MNQCRKIVMRHILSSIRTFPDLSGPNDEKVDENENICIYEYLQNAPKFVIFLEIVLILPNLKDFKVMFQRIARYSIFSQE